MAMAGRLRSGLPLLRTALTAPIPPPPRDLSLRNLSFALLSPNRRQEFQSSRHYASGAPAKEQKVKVPMTMFGLSGNYASALYISAVKANVLDKVESELLSLVEASNESPTFYQFIKDTSVDTDKRVKAMTDICGQAKYSDITKNFLVIFAENGRLGQLERIAQRFSELTLAHRGEVKVTVTTVIPLPAEEEKELREALLHILGEAKNVKIEQKIDRSILGGILVAFGQKVLDMSIKTRAAQMERFLRQPISLDGY